MPAEPRRHVLDLPQLEAVESPVRHQLLRLLTSLRRATAKEMAVQMGRSPESLYYHLHALEEVGLVRPAGERCEGPRPEVEWARVAGTLVTDATRSDGAYLEAMRRSGAALLRLAERQLAAALERQEEAGDERHPALRIQQRTARLSRGDLRELNRRIDAVLDFVAERDDPDAGERVSLLVHAAPLEPEPTPRGGSD